MYSNVFLTIGIFCITFGAGNGTWIVPGQGCGSTTPIKKVEKPSDTDTCAIILDQHEYNAYKEKKMREQGCTGRDKNCCVPDAQCQVDEGQCSTDTDCIDILTCQAKSCSQYPFEDCCQFPRCDEHFPNDQDTCCHGPDAQTYGYTCGHDEGVCSADSDCAGESTCQEISCSWDVSKSCCYDVCEDLVIIDSCQYKGKRATGTDIISPYTSYSLDDCWVDCVDTASCKAFSWRCTDKLCELKGDDFAYEDHVGYVSGLIFYMCTSFKKHEAYKSTAGPVECSCAEANLDRLNDNRGYFPDVLTMGMCQALCQEDPDCVIFQYATSRTPKNGPGHEINYCWTKGAGPKNDIVNPSYIAGPAYCP